MNDFDFLVGTWDVHNRRLPRWFADSSEWDEFPATSWCWSMFGGAANTDEINFPTRDFTGLTLRLYDPVREVWSLNWVNSRDGLLTPPVVGRFTGGRGEFYGDDLHDGIPIRIRFIWSKITPTSARWEQACSIDSAQTWEDNWVMDFTRTG